LSPTARMASVRISPRTPARRRDRAPERDLRFRASESSAAERFHGFAQYGIFVVKAGGGAAGWGVGSEACFHGGDDGFESAGERIRRVRNSMLRVLASP